LRLEIFNRKDREGIREGRRGFEEEKMSTTVGEYEATRVEESPAAVKEKAAANGGGQKSAPASSRILSLDVFRGMTVAGMILVNNPGTWSAIYSPLEHAAWHGWTPTDLIFPFFLFIVGVSITLALSRRVEATGSKRDVYLKIVRRTLLIYALGTFLAWFPFYNFNTHAFVGFTNVRLTGVLDRIAVCYLFAAVIFLKTDWRRQALVVAGLLLAYWAILMLVAAPGFAAGDLSKEGSIASYVDRALLGTHIWKGGDRVYDPEGFLSTLGALATTLCGVLAGHLLRSRRTALEKVALMFVGSGTSFCPSTSLCGRVHTSRSRRGWRCNCSPSATGSSTSKATSAGLCPS
jgi:predicted acyltransferase